MPMSNFFTAHLQRASANCRCIIVRFQHRKRKISAAPYAIQHQLSASRSLSSASKTSSDTSSNPFITDEGIKIFTADPDKISSGHGLTWGSVLWPAGACLAKYLHWSQTQQQTRATKRSDADIIINNKTRVLELGCGTGVVGLTCAKLGAKHVTLSDSATELWPNLRKSIEANEISDDAINIYGLDWRDPSTFLKPSIRSSRQDNRYHLVVAADVLYAGMDGLFARALASHLPSSDEIDGQEPPVAVIACPFRPDSPLFNFFGILKRLGLELDRLEDVNGNAAGGDAPFAFNESSFIPMCREGEREEEVRWFHVAAEPTFSLCNRDKVQIFRVRRVSGRSEDARAIRRVGRI